MSLDGLLSQWRSGSFKRYLQSTDFTVLPEFCHFRRKSPSIRLCFLFYFRALASSAPIWQFPGMVPCGDFYKIVTQDFARSGYNCDANIRKSWKAVTNVSSTGEAGRHNEFMILICHISE